MKSIRKLFNRQPKLSNDNQCKYSIDAAIKENNFETFVQLLGATNQEQLRNADVNLRQPGARITPFLHCATYGRYEMLEYMLNIPNMNVNQTDSRGRNALAEILYSHKID